MMIFLYLFGVLYVVAECTGSNILLLHPVVCRSHELVFLSLGEGLAARGHDMTLVRFKGGRMHSDLYRTIDLEIERNGRDIPFMNEDGVVEPPHDYLWKTSLTYSDIPWEIEVPICAACETLLNMQHLFNVTSFGEPYDVVIVDILANECGLALANHLGVPVIAYWASVMNAGEILFYGAPYPASYVPAVVTGFTDRMTFFERLLNLGYITGGWLFSRFVLLYPTYKTYTKLLPNAPFPDELIQNISALFVNTDVSLDFARPILPNTVNVGCLWCRVPRSLPSELESFMQSAGEHGVIVFSLGATFKADVVPRADILAFMQALARLPQKVIMKLEGQIDADIPPNVLRVKWMPQQDILGHNQTRAFISHCGMHGVMEAIYHQVPIVGMPIFADQVDVLARLLDRGIAVPLNKRNLKSDIIYDAITKVLTDHSYKENMKRISAIMKDSPQTAMERAIYWTEYVIRHRGAEHLKTADRHLNLFQYWMLDVFLVLFTIVMAATYLIVKSCKITYRVFLQGKSKTD